jgi:sugar phosphate isomerase/epimerase
MRLHRRRFLAALGASAAFPAILRSATPKKRLPIAFSTLGCPGWDWKTVLDTADRLGYAALELRGVKGEMDLPTVPELSGTRLAGSKRDLAALGLVVSDLGASTHMHEKDAAARLKQLDDGRRFIDLAHAMDVKYVRMFGNNIPPGEPREDVFKRVADGFREMAEYARPAGVVVLIESHGDFVHAADLADLLTRVSSDAFALLWDAHHTFAAAGEPPAETFGKLGKWVRHTHLKDSKPAPSGKVEDRHYVLTGTGDVPVKEQVAVLAKGGYQGYYCYEWEKKWHPDIEEPEVAFPHYAKVMGEYLAAAGVKPA